MNRMTDEEKAIILQNVQLGIVPPPNPLQFLRGKGIKTMKEQAKKLRQLEKNDQLKDEPMADWLAKPFKSPK